MRISVSTPSSKLRRVAKPADSAGLISSSVSRALGAPGGTTNVVVKDANVTRRTTQAVVTDFSLSPNFKATEGAPVWSSSDEAIATVDQEGNVAYVSDGSVVITALIGRGRFRFPLVMSSTTASSFDVFSSFVSGSLANHIGIQAGVILNAKDPATCAPIFATQYTSENQTWLRNISNVLAGTSNFQAISASNSASGSLLSLTPIAPDIVLSAAHIGAFNTGTVVTWVTADNVAVSRTITGNRRIQGTDLYVYSLDSNLPASIGFFKVLPSDIFSYLPTPSGRVPAVYRQRDNLIGTFDLYGVGSNPTWGPNIQFEDPIPGGYSAFQQPRISGTSGSPIFLPIGGELVLASVFTGPTYGPRIHENAAAINAAMTSLGSVNTVVPYNLAAPVSFPSY